MEKLGGRDERRETVVEYDPWHTAEYATALEDLIGCILQGMG